ncbi:hypothetical protein GCM10011519_29750 [Marmoricola endophyticus]|uniref:Bacteriocin biosynthesis cyclodehydratase domain-containing protein n=1 Tax=Marmoricola endophyticus TaxID=2040280 RepID=A0A917BPF9_9ACTN|nr:TOMM precursor leader peptide-binding protein [Marmoricola endophyticus]GGF53900.1 hypothetical protein GCM10011519_29750 [Marmoricola endophyticus]
MDTAPVSIRESASPAASGPDLYALSGELAERVFERSGLPAERALTPARLRAVLEGDEAPVGVALVALVGTGEDEGLRDALDAWSVRRGIASTAVEVLPTRIVVGPTVVPGHGACHRCYRRRQAQHAVDGAGRDLDSTGLPEGFGNHHVAVVTSLLRLAAEDRYAGRGGTVRSLDLVRGTVSTASVVPVHGCDRCGTGEHDDRPAAWVRLDDREGR